MKYFFALALLLNSGLSWSFNYTLQMTEQQIQQQIDAMMPLKEKQLFFLITLNDAKVDLIAGKNAISLFSQIRVDVSHDVHATGRAEIAGTLAYNPQQGAFYLHNAVVKTLEVDQLDTSLLPAIKQLAQSTIRQSLDKYPVYRLSDNDLRQKLAKSALKSVRVENEILKATLSPF